MTKNQEILLQVRYFTRGDKVFQHFIIVKKQKSKYLLSSKYLLNVKFEKFIEDNALSLHNENYRFCSKSDRDNEIVMEFEIVDPTIKKEFKSFFANITGPTPTSDGCDECRYFKTDGETFYCDKREKEIDKRYKTCRFYKQKENK